MNQEYMYNITHSIDLKSFDGGNLSSGDMSVNPNNQDEKILLFSSICQRFKGIQVIFLFSVTL